MKEILDSACFTNMVLCGYDALSANEQAINELNVFPVPDGDTGTNMCMTFGAGAADLRKNGPSDTLTATADRVASALLRGARGNSGVILSLLFRGISKGLKKLDTATPAEFAKAMNAGVEAAYKAVMKPAEGTILTVSRLASEAASNCARHSSDLEAVLSAALETARVALADTVNQNPVLEKAGVVDAGGYGYTLIIEAMLGYLQGRVEVSTEASAGNVPTKAKADFAAISDEEITFTYCTEFIVRRENDKNADLLREYLGTLGDCIVVVDDDEIIKTHVHTNAPGKVLTKALTYGSLLTVKVENMREQHTNMSGGAETEPAAAEEEPANDIPAPVDAEKPIGTVCVCAGDGIQELFRQLGADGIVSGGQTMNPSTEDILRAVNLTPADTVFIFPNNKNIIMAAEQCIPLTTKTVIVIPSKTIPQGVSAMMRLSPDAPADVLTQDFISALDSVHTALVTYAARDSEFDGMTIHAGEYLTLLDGALVGSFPDAASMVDGLRAPIAEVDPEFITVYSGEGVADEDAQAFCEQLGVGMDDVETTLVPGGQPVYYYIIGIE